MGQEAQRAEPVGHGHHQHATARQRIAVVQRHAGRTVVVAAAVDPDDHRQRPARPLGRRPDVQVEAVLADGGRRLARHRHALLHAGRGEGGGRAHAGPGRQRGRFAPAQLAQRRGGPQQHLVRDTLLNLETRLDPRRFARIHRRMLVALDRIRQIETAANGDAILHLAAGAELRVSRSYRAALRARWQRPDVLL